MSYGVYPRQKFRDPPRSRSGLKGVIFCRNLTKKRWKAYGRDKGWYVTIGYFQTKEEAAQAYNAWAVSRFGATAYLNPPPAFDAFVPSSRAVRRES